MTAPLAELTAPAIDMVATHAKLLSKVAAGILSLSVNMKLAPEEEDLPLSRSALFLVMFVGVAALTFSIEPALRTLWLEGMALLSLGLVVVYYVLRVHFSVEKEFDYKPQWWKVWDRQRMKVKFVLGGFVMRPEAKAELAKEGMTKAILLLDAGGEESLVWTERSRTTLKGTIFTLYLLSSAGATCVVLLAAETFVFLKGH